MVCQLRAVYFWNQNTISPLELNSDSQGREEQHSKESKYDIQKGLLQQLSEGNWTFPVTSAYKVVWFSTAYALELE